MQPNKTDLINQNEQLLNGHQEHQSEVLSVDTKKEKTKNKQNKRAMLETRLLKKKEEQEKLKNQISEMKKQLAAVDKKKRNHRLFIYGGLVEKYFISDEMNIPDDREEFQKFATKLFEGIVAYYKRGGGKLPAPLAIKKDE